LKQIVIEECEISFDEQGFLDGLLDQAIAALENGAPLETDEIAKQRPDLRNRIEQVLRLAHEITPGLDASFPTVPGYDVLAELGRGGMGAVYLARQRVLGDRPVALKVLPPSATLSERARKRFLHEANAIAKLRHPHVVAIYDVVHEKGIYAYAMEWVDGKSLGELIDHLSSTSEPQTMTEVCRILESPASVLFDGTLTIFICRIGIAVARALAAVHAAGLLHRDIKPTNILLRRDGTALLTDFGLVREADSTVQTIEGQFAGTPAYAPPEQLRGETKTVDARSDVYAMGVTLYHALSLRLPFSGNTSAQLLKHIETGKAEPLRKANPRLPTDLQTIVEKAMDPEPARRYQTADDLADDLDRLLNLQPIRARPASLVTRTFKLYRRNRRAFIAASLGSIASFLIAVALSIYFFVVPGWVKAHVDQARFALLDPKQANAVFNAIFFGQDSSDSVWRVNGIKDELSTRAVASYDAALRWNPGDEFIRLERDIVQLARDFMRLHCALDDDTTSLVAPTDPLDPKIPELIAKGAPIAAEYVRRWSREGRRPLVKNIELYTTTATDLRSLGLLALLLGDMQNAMLAWAQLDLIQDPDPLVEALLGEMYLVSGKGALAYPRLRNAVAAYPDLGFLTTYLADAALQSGDFAKAEQLVHRARGMKTLDDLGALDRVEADLYGATGRTELARQRHDWLRIHIGGAPGLLSYAGLLEREGELRLALILYASIHDTLVQSSRNKSGPTHRLRVAPRLVEVADRWWEQLSDAERRRLLRSLIDDMAGPAPMQQRRSWLDTFQLETSPSLQPGKHCQFDVLMRAYCECLAIVELARPDAPMPPSSSGKSLRSLLNGVNQLDASCWQRLAAYAPFLKDLQTAAWLSSDPAPLSRMTEFMDIAWRTATRFSDLQIATPTSLPKKS